MYTAQDLLGKVDSYAVELAELLQMPRLRFLQLREREVPEAAGLYVIYLEQPLEVLYVGQAKRRTKASARSQPDGLRFRIMRNHLAYQGDDNFIKYVTSEYGLSSRADAREFVRKECSIHWREVEDLARLSQLERFAITALRPRLNRG
jgi:hypothetical protein